MGEWAEAPQWERIRLNMGRGVVGWHPIEHGQKVVGECQADMGSKHHTIGMNVCSKQRTRQKYG